MFNECKPRPRHAPVSVTVFPATLFPYMGIPEHPAVYVYPGDHEGSHYAYYEPTDASIRRLMRYLKANHEPVRVVLFDNGQVNNHTWEVR